MAACLSTISSGRLPDSALKKLLSLNGKPVIQFRLPMNDSASIRKSSIPLQIVRFPMRALGPISSRSGQMIENPIRAVEWILYPKSKFKATRRTTHGKHNRSTESVHFIAYSNRLCDQLCVGRGSCMNVSPAHSCKSSLTCAHILARAGCAPSCRADLPGASKPSGSIRQLCPSDFSAVLTSARTSSLLLRASLLPFSLKS